MLKKKSVGFLGEGVVKMEEEENGGRNKWRKMEEENGGRNRWRKKQMEEEENGGTDLEFALRFLRVRSFSEPTRRFLRKHQCKKP